MGGGGSKQAQLERYGQLLSQGERQALENTFHDIAASPDASFLTEQQLKVCYDAADSKTMFSIPYCRPT